MLLASVGWPVLDRFRIGSRFAISPHGLGIAIGFMIGASLLTRIAPKRFYPRSPGDTPEARAALEAKRAEVRSHYETMLFWALIGTIIGARLFYVIAHYSDFNGIGDMLAIWRGGISLLGGIAGAVLINLRRIRRFGHRFFQVMDPTVICIALGIGIGRSGDLIIGDHLGKPTSWLLAWTYHGGVLAPPWVCNDTRTSCTAVLQGGAREVFTRTGATLYDAAGRAIGRGVGVHQTAMYDMIIAWCLFALLWRLSKRPGLREGVLTLTFGLCYGLARILEDSVRIDKRFGPFTGSQWTSLVVATISAITLIAWGVQKRRDAAPGGKEPEPAPDAAESA